MIIKSFEIKKFNEEIIGEKTKLGSSFKWPGTTEMNWLKERVKEISTWSGASLVALGLLVVLGGPLVKMAAYAAIIWGIISIVKKQG